MKLATNWMTRLYQNGAELVNFTMEQSSHIDHLLGCIESRDNSNSMHYHAANRCCIHCQGTHASEDHYLSVSVPPVFNSGHIGLLPPLEQAQTTTSHNRPVLVTFSAIHFQCSTTTSTMASTSQTNPTYDVLSFNACDCLVALHQEITDFLHYQSHVQYATTASLLPNTTTANQRERETIIEFLKEEHACIRMLKRLLNMADTNTTELQMFFEDSPVDNDINWGDHLGPNATMGATTTATSTR